MSLPIPPTATTAGMAVSAPAPAPQPSGGAEIQLGRLVAWELFLAWRRRGMVITLASLLLVGYLLIQFFIWLTWVSLSDSLEAQATIARSLAFPGSTAVAGSYFNYVGALLLVALVGALIGSEYTYGTHRLSLARGVGRGQLLAAQVIAVALLALITSAGLLLLGTLLGVVGGVSIGAGEPATVAGLGELLVYWLAVALNAFVYSLLALWIGTLGRSMAAAIAGPLVYIFVEGVATNIFGIFKFAPNPDATTRFIASIPDYLLGTNTNELILLSGQSPYKLFDYSGSLGAVHASIVILVYCALFTISAYLIFRGRDVRE
jgi:ABC-2 type transport system permease protein